MKAVIVSLMIGLLPIRSSTAFAANHDMEDLRLKKIIDARSLVQLEREQKRLNELQRAHAECQVELKTAAVPAACFTVVAFEEAERLLRPSRAAATRQWLSDVCRRNAKQMTAMDRLERSLAHSALSPECREIVQRRANELHYMAVDRFPDRVFADRSK